MQVALTLWTHMIEWSIRYEEKLMGACGPTPRGDDDGTGDGARAGSTASIAAAGVCARRETVSPPVTGFRCGSVFWGIVFVAGAATTRRLVGQGD